MKVDYKTYILVSLFYKENNHFNFLYLKIVILVLKFDKLKYFVVSYFERPKNKFSKIYKLILVKNKIKS